VVSHRPGALSSGGIAAVATVYDACLADVDRLAAPDDVVGVWSGGVPLLGRRARRPQFIVVQRHVPPDARP